MANHTKVRHVRVPGYRWFLAGLTSARRGEDRSKIINDRLEAYNRKHATPEDIAEARAAFPDDEAEQ